MASKGKNPVIEQEAVVGDIVIVNHYGVKFHGFVYDVCDLQFGVINIDEPVLTDQKPVIIHVLKVGVEKIVTNDFHWFNGFESHMIIREFSPDIAATMDYLEKKHSKEIDWQKTPKINHLLLITKAHQLGTIKEKQANKLIQDICALKELIQ